MNARALPGPSELTQAGHQPGPPVPNKPNKVTHHVIVFSQHRTTPQTETGTRHTLSVPHWPEVRIFLLPPFFVCLYSCMEQKHLI